jgi:DNA polymerase-3 subunit epsilon
VRNHRLVYIRCRLDIAFPILEVAGEPAAGHALTIGPVHNRKLAVELVEQLDSLFGLRHCGRTLPRREHPSAYGQMGRCLSPCLGDLDPNLYRRRLDEALAAFVSSRRTTPAQTLLAHVDEQMRKAARQQRFERAEWLRRRGARLRKILEGLEGMLEATHARPRLVLAAHPTRPRADAFWLVGGRVVDWVPVSSATAAGELAARTTDALRRRGRQGDLGAHVPPAEVDEIRIVGNYLASHQDVPQLTLDPLPDQQSIARFVADAVPAVPDSSGERELDDLGADAGRADGHGRAWRRLASHEGQRDRAESRRGRGARDAPDLSALELNLFTAADLV